MLTSHQLETQAYSPRKPPVPRPVTASAAEGSPRKPSTTLSWKSADHQLERRVAQLQAQLQAAALQIDALRSSYEALANRCALLETSRRQIEGVVTKQRRSLTQSQAMVADLVKSKAELEQAVKDGEEKQLELRLLLDDKGRRLKQASELEASLTQRLEASEAEVAHLTSSERDSKETADKMVEEKSQLAEKLAILRQTHEQTRVELLNEAEATRSIEAKRLALEVFIQELQEMLESTKLSLTRERQKSLLSRSAAFDRGSRVTELEEQLKRASKQVATMEKELAASRKSDQQGRAELSALHVAVRTAAESIVSLGASTDPRRLHNEKIVSTLLKALEARNGAGDQTSHSSCSVGVTSTPDATLVALAAMSQEQRAQTEELVNQYREATKAAQSREKAVRRRALDLRAKLQRYGDWNAEVRRSVCDELSMIGNLEQLDGMLLE